MDPEIVLESREFVKNLLLLRSSFGIPNPEQVAMVAIRNLVAIQGSQPWSKPSFQNVSGVVNQNRNPDLNPGRNPDRNLRSTEHFRVAIRVVNHNPETQPEGPKIRKPCFFLWLRSGLLTGFRLQFCNPETFWNGGYEQVATRVAI